jgi:hypothetical protein
MKMKIKQGVMAAENLKKRMRETATNTGLTPPSTTSSLPSPSIVPQDDCKFNHKF